MGYKFRPGRECSVGPSDLLREGRGPSRAPRPPRILAQLSSLQTQGGRLASPGSSTLNTHSAPCFPLPGHWGSSLCGAFRAAGPGSGWPPHKPPWVSPQTQSPQGRATW